MDDSTLSNQAETTAVSEPLPRPLGYCWSLGVKSCVSKKNAEVAAKETHGEATSIEAK